MSGNVRPDSELEFLTAIERGEVVTQMALTKRIGVSIGLVNALLKRGIRKGYVKARRVPLRRYAYCLTPKGFGEKSRLLAVYLERSLSFFRQARDEYADVLVRARAQGKSKFVLVGAGELAEIAITAARGEGIGLLALLDSHTNQNECCGLRVIRSLEEIDRFDAVVITESRTPQDSYNAMRRQLTETQVLVPPLLKVARDHGDLAAAAQEMEHD